MTDSVKRIILNSGPTLNSDNEQVLPSLQFNEPGFSTDQNFLLIGTGTGSPHLIQTTHTKVVLDFSETPGTIQRRVMTKALSTPAAPAFQTNSKSAQPSGICEPTDGDVGIVVKGVLIGRFTPTGLVLGGSLTYSSGGGVVLSYGTTAQRPADPVHGFFWHNTTIDTLEWYDSNTTTWREAGGGGGGGGALSPWTSVTSAYNVQAGERIIANTDAGAFIVTLPASPVDKAEIWVIGDFATRALTIARNGKQIARRADDFVLNRDNIGAKLVFDATIDSWRVWP